VHFPPTEPLNLVAMEQKGLGHLIKTKSRLVQCFLVIANI
jgi:hypothetical protein